MDNARLGLDRNTVGPLSPALRVKSLSQWSEWDSLAESAIKEIREATDRSAAIVAAAFVEDYLTIAIRAAAQEDHKLLENAFSPEGVFGSFGLKIKIGFMLGLYDPQLRKELEALAKIRNRFAHRRTVDSFEGSEVCNLVHKLVAGEKINITLTGLGKSETRTGIIKEPIKPGMTLRDRFIETCYMFLRIFSAMHIGLEPAAPMISIAQNTGASLKSKTAGPSRKT